MSTMTLNGTEIDTTDMSVEKIERLKQVDRLPNILKLRYETWKSKQPKKNDTSIKGAKRKNKYTNAVKLMDRVGWQ